jgi:hypothetical protein
MEAFMSVLVHVLYSQTLLLRIVVFRFVVDGRIWKADFFKLLIERSTIFSPGIRDVAMGSPLP